MEAKRILELNEKWNNTDSTVISDNVEKLLDDYKYSSDKIKKLMNITSSSQHAVMAWLNRGRPNVKIPFLKLCAIAAYYNIDLNDLMEVKK